jgi:hypothetical protein
LSAILPDPAFQKIKKKPLFPPKRAVLLIAPADNSRPDPVKGKYIGTEPLAINTGCKRAGPNRQQQRNSQDDRCYPYRYTHISSPGNCSHIPFP